MDFFKESHPQLDRVQFSGRLLRVAIPASDFTGNRPLMIRKKAGSKIETILFLHVTMNLKIISLFQI